MKNPLSEKSVNLGYIENLIGPESTNLPIPIEFSGFQCPHCLSYYQHIDTLNNHIDREHPNDFIKCSMCPEKFKYPNKLNEHIRKCHPYEPEDTSSKFSNLEVPMIYKKEKQVKKGISNNVKKSREEWKKSKRIVKTTIFHPLCFGKYGGPELCKHCKNKKDCKKISN